MTFKNEEDILRVFDWSVGSKMIYLMKKLQDSNSDDVFNQVVTVNKLMKEKSFNTYINKINRLKDDIQFLNG